MIRSGWKRSIASATHWLSGSDSGALPGKRRGSLPVALAQYLGASDSQPGVGKLRFRSTPLALTRNGLVASKPSGLRTGTTFHSNAWAAGVCILDIHWNT